MPHIDDFIQFVAEELMKEGSYSLVIDAPATGEKFWLAGTWRDGKEYLTHGDELEDVLNRLSIGLDFTSKDMPVMQVSPPSPVMTAAMAATQLGKSLRITAPSGNEGWRLEVEETKLRAVGLDLRLTAELLYDKIAQESTIGGTNAR